MKLVLSFSPGIEEDIPRHSGSRGARLPEIKSRRQKEAKGSNYRLFVQTPRCRIMMPRYLTKRVRSVGF
ncbi:MAG: hypothetical protein KAQ82_03330, partial [Dehalococcoidia bacterium]|nr:hypothetical protein [Dehalococcoidia bacterium]